MTSKNYKKIRDSETYTEIKEELFTHFIAYSNKDDLFELAKVYQLIERLFNSEDFPIEEYNKYGLRKVQKRK